MMSLLLKIMTMKFSIYKIEHNGKIAISKKSVQKDNFRCVELASFKTEQLRDFTYESLRQTMKLNSAEYGDRKFI